MKNINVKVFIYILVGLSALFWIGLALLAGLKLSDFWTIIKILPSVATVDLLVFGLFSKWGWRWEIFQRWLVPFPDLNGTWQGHINSNWQNPETSERLPPIPAILTIKQTFMKVSCVLKTAEMTSHSFIEGFSLDRDRQIKQLTFSYTSKPRPSVAERSNCHDGTMVFEIIRSPSRKLDGRYWTDRKTTGEITLDYREKKLLEEIPSDLPPHPMSR